MPTLGFHNIDERSNLTKLFDHKAIRRARLVFIMQCFFKNFLDYLRHKYIPKRPAQPMTQNRIA